MDEYYSSEFYLATIYVPDNDIGYQFLAGFGANLEIIEPKSYTENFLHFLYKIVEKYDLQYKKQTIFTPLSYYAVVRKQLKLQE